MSIPPRESEELHVGQFQHAGNPAEAFRIVTAIRNGRYVTLRKDTPMPRIGITYDEVAAAADAIAAENMHPTVPKMRERLGTGSAGTIH